MSIELKSDAPSTSLYRSNLPDSNKAGLGVEGWKFALSPNLENGALSLAPEEVILYTWNYKSTALSQDEFITSILTFGIYYFITRIYKRRRRVYKIIITNNRVIIKEEMFESTGFCALEKQLIEDQSSYPITALRYICTEQIDKLFCGLFPPSVVLEIHFTNIPSWSKLPESSYIGGSVYLKKAFIGAFKDSYGIDFNASIVDRTGQIANNSSSLINPFNLIFFGAYFFYYLLTGLFSGILDTIRAFYNDPIVGSRQVNGTLNAKVFRWEADTSQDPQCSEHVQGVLKAISGQLKKTPIIPSEVNSELHRSVKIYDSFDSFSPLNTRGDYGSYSGFVYYNNIFPLKSDDVIRDIAQDNPVFTWSDVWSIINTFGIYYFTDLHNKLTNWTTNYVVTDSVIVRQQIVVAPVKRSVHYSRADIWIPEFCDFSFISESPEPFCGVKSNQSNTFAAGSYFYGIEFESRSLAFGSNLLKYLTSKTEKFDYSLTTNTKLTDAEFTQSLLHLNETVDSSIKSTPKFPCCYCVLSCGLISSNHDVFTATSHGLYLESYQNSYCFPQLVNRRVIFFSWEHVGGFYWSNYDTSFCEYQCCKCGCSSCCKCCDTEGDLQFPPHGYRGSRLRVQIDQGNSFSFGIDIPRVFYAQSESKLNAIIDTVSLRNYVKGQRVDINIV
uniref:Uncharacterized protein n=1 Tax=Chromulina nebulosa TaxID=96789 RepID=A0A7S0XDW7_9STRA|mmetsp:Transcript_1317/g.1159  ORF Transcript_1317/g.1159 Transcript_1317/m.1159 type:complete len:669 (+) Transcript_1317:40-2046(+)